MPVTDRHAIHGTPLDDPFAGNGDGALRHGLFLGRREGLLAAAGVHSTSVGYAGGYTPERQLRGSLLRSDGPHRSRARRVRSERDLL